MEYYALRDGPVTLFLIIGVLARLSTVAFSTFLVALLVVRVTPVSKSVGFMPRATALLGTFLAISFLLLPREQLSPLPTLIAIAFIVIGMSLSIYTLAWLGRSFSIMPEARRLVTNGPYTHVCHPLYAFEEIAMVGTAMQFVQPWSLLLLLVHFMLQLARMGYEENVLAEAFHDYAAYAARTARLIPEVY